MNCTCKLPVRAYQGITDECMFHRFKRLNKIAKHMSRLEIKRENSYLIKARRETGTESSKQS